MRSLWSFFQQGFYNYRGKLSQNSDIDALLQRYQIAIEAVRLQIRENLNQGVMDIVKMLSDLNLVGPCLYIDSKGNLTKACISAIYSQSHLTKRSDIIKSKLKTLCLFVEVMSLNP